MKKGQELIKWWQNIDTVKRECLWNSYKTETTKNRPTKSATYSEIEKLYKEVIKDDFFKIGK